MTSASTARTTSPRTSAGNSSGFTLRSMHEMHSLAEPRPCPTMDALPAASRQTTPSGRAPCEDPDMARRSSDQVRDLAQRAPRGQDRVVRTPYLRRRLPVGSDQDPLPGTTPHGQCGYV